MRTVFASLILAAGLAGAAQAQTQASAVAGAPAAPAAAPAAPATTTPPAAGAQPGASTAAAPAAEAPPAPSLPTSGDGAAVIQALEKVCVPAVHSGLESAAKAAGLRQNRRDETWTMPQGGDRAYVIIFQPQYSQKNVCHAEIHYAVGQEKPIIQALNVWSYLHKPELVLQANYINVDADGVKRVRKSWEHVEANGASTAVNFTVERKPDDTPLNGRFDTGQLYYQERAGS